MDGKMITLYSTGCMECKIVKKMLDNKGLKYIEENNNDIILKIARENNICEMPFANIDNKIYGRTELKKYIMEV